LASDLRGSASLSIRAQLLARVEIRKTLCQFHVDPELIVFA
jgi:hypothetical protein